MEKFKLNFHRDVLLFYCASLYAIYLTKRFKPADGLISSHPGAFPSLDVD